MTLEELSKRVALFGAKLHGSCGDWMDIEFPSILSACSFVQSLDWQTDARLRDPVSRFAGTVVVQVPESVWKSWNLLDALRDRKQAN